MSEKKDIQQQKIKECNMEELDPELNAQCVEAVQPNILPEKTSNEIETFHLLSEVKNIDTSVTPSVWNKIKIEHVSEIIKNILDCKNKQAAKITNQSTEFKETEIIDLESLDSIKHNAHPKDFADAAITKFKNLDENVYIQELTPKVIENKSDNSIITRQRRLSRTYRMDYKYRGLALIYNNFKFDKTKYAPRYGTEKDVERLKKDLLLLGFKREHIIEHPDLTKLQIFGSVYRVSEKYEQILKNSDCIFVFILTHGEKGNLLMAKDISYDLYEFIGNFTSETLPELATKPKFFFIQACRGNAHDKGVIIRQIVMDNTDGNKSDEEEPYSYPIYADLFIGFSSHHNHVSFRNVEGSWFIQSFCNALRDANLEEESLEDIMCMVKLLVSQRLSSDDKEKQIPAIYSTLTRKVHFKQKH